MPTQAARDTHDASARVRARPRRSGAQDLDLGFLGRVREQHERQVRIFVTSSSSGRPADARQRLSVAAPDAEIELEGHAVALGELGSAGLPSLRARRIRPAIVSQRPSQFL